MEEQKDVEEENGNWIGDRVNGETLEEEEEALARTETVIFMSCDTRVDTNKKFISCVRDKEDNYKEQAMTGLPT